MAAPIDTSARLGTLPEDDLVPGPPHSVRAKPAAAYGVNVAITHGCGHVEYQHVAYYGIGGQDAVACAERAFTPQRRCAACRTTPSLFT